MLYLNYILIYLKERKEKLRISFFFLEMWLFNSGLFISLYSSIQQIFINCLAYTNGGA